MTTVEPKNEPVVYKEPAFADIIGGKNFAM